MCFSYASSHFYLFRMRSISDQYARGGRGPLNSEMVMRHYVKLPLIIYMKTVSSIAHYDFLCICMWAFTTQELCCVTSNVNSECLWLKSSVAFKE